MVQYSLVGITADQHTIVAQNGVDGPAALQRWAARAGDGKGKVMLVDQGGVKLFLDLPDAGTLTNWKSGQFIAPCVQASAEADSPEGAVKGFAEVFSTRAASIEEAEENLLVRLTGKYASESRATAGLHKVRAMQRREGGGDKDGITTYYPTVLHVTPQGADVSVTVRVPLALAADASNWQVG